MPWASWREWPEAIKRITCLVAEVNGVTDDQAAAMVWEVGERELGFPVGWIRTNAEIRSVCDAAKRKFTKPGG
jgi:hypothetical protein